LVAERLQVAGPAIGVETGIWREIFVVNRPCREIRCCRSSSIAAGRAHQRTCQKGRGGRGLRSRPAPSPPDADQRGSATGNAQQCARDRVIAKRRRLWKDNRVAPIQRAWREDQGRPDEGVSCPAWGAVKGMGKRWSWWGKRGRLSRRAGGRGRRAWIKRSPGGATKQRRRVSGPRDEAASPRAGQHEELVALPAPASPRLARDGGERGRLVGAHVGQLETCPQCTAQRGAFALIVAGGSSGLGGRV